MKSELRELCPYKTDPGDFLVPSAVWRHRKLTALWTWVWFSWFCALRPGREVNPWSTVILQWPEPRHTLKGREEQRFLSTHISMIMLLERPWWNLRQLRSPIRRKLAKKVRIASRGHGRKLTGRAVSEPLFSVHDEVSFVRTTSKAHATLPAVLQGQGSRCKVTWSQHPSISQPPFTHLHKKSPWQFRFLPDSWRF